MYISNVDSGKQACMCKNQLIFFVQNKVNLAIGDNSKSVAELVFWFY